MFPTITSDFISFHHEVCGFPNLEAEEERSLLVEAKLGCKKSLQKIITTHLRVVTSQVMQLQRKLEECFDMFQEGCLALLDSVRSFDLAYQNRFSTHCFLRVKSAILEWIRNNRQIKLWNSKPLKKVMNNCKKYDYRSPEGRAKACNELEVDESVIEDFLEKSSTNYLTSYVSGEGEENCIYEAIKSDSDIEAEFIESSEKLLIPNLMKGINDRQRYVLEQIYYCERSKSDIAGELGVSVQRVFQIEKEGIAAMGRMVA